MNQIIAQVLCLSLYCVSGQPSAYPEYFSLNRSTAELRLLKPVDRELYQRFTLVIKVIISSSGYLL